MDISKIKIDNSVLDVKDTTARSTLQLLGTASVKDAPASGNASNSLVVLGSDTRLSDPRPASDVYEWAKASTKPTYTKSDVGLGNVTNDSQVKRSEMGAASGVATLDSTGKVPSTQLPSYVDDVIEGYMYNGKFYEESTHETLITGESGKIYSDLSTSKIYRWGGSAFAVISDTITVGTTQGTAFDGKSGYDHVNNTSNPHSVTKSQVGLGNVTNTGDSDTPVSGGTTKFTTGGAYTELAKKVDKVTGKGLSTNDYTTDEKNKLAGIASGAEVNVQSDWNAESGDAFIKNKPTSMPASDVYSWAKAANKPSYTLDEVSDGSTRKLADKIGKTIEITWANLKSLRDNSQLVPGQFYRITDYVTVTNEKNTQSTGHQFDVIVRADNVNTLNENASADLHEGDIYYVNRKIKTWELKYSIDNLYWAKANPIMTVSGVEATYVGEEYNYKKLQLDSAVATNIYPGHTTNLVYVPSLSNGATVYVYLGSMVSFTTLSLEEVEDNGKGVIYYMKDEYNNECPYDFTNITFFLSSANRYCYTFEANQGSNCSDFIKYGTCINNKIGPYINNKEYKIPFNCFLYLGTGSSIYTCTISNNTIINNSNNNIFTLSPYSSCAFNYLSNYCSYNSFGLNCSYNSFGNYCTYNSFGDNCSSNSFGNNCSRNSFGNACNSNSFGNNCAYNSFGNYCCYNSFGLNCTYNSFGNRGCHNSFGNTCSHNRFDREAAWYNIIENGNGYITLTSTQTTSASNKLQNIKICQGVNNTSTTKTISHDTLNDTFQTEYKPANSQVISV